MQTRCLRDICFSIVAAYFLALLRSAWFCINFLQLYLFHIASPFSSTPLSLYAAVCCWPLPPQLCGDGICSTLTAVQCAQLRILANFYSTNFVRARNSEMFEFMQNSLHHHGLLSISNYYLRAYFLLQHRQLCQCTSSRSTEIGNSFSVMDFGRCVAFSIFLWFV